MKKLTKSQSFYFSLISFIAGVFAGNFLILLHFYPFLALLTLLFVLIVLVIGNKSNKYLFIVLFLCSFTLGFWRFQVAQPDFTDQSKIYHYSSTTVEFSGVVKNVDSRIGGQKLTVETQLLERRSGAQKISGLTLINQPLYPEYAVGDKLEVKCLLERPGMIEDFDYGKYLAKENIFITCGFAEVKTIGRLSWTPMLTVFGLRQYLARRLNSSISEPEVSLLRGIVLGDSRGLPENYKKMFADLGLSHITAISGDHIAIVAAALLQLLIALGLSRPKAFWPLAAIVVFYVLLVGAPASAVRAALMALSVMYAQKIGRGSSIKTVLVLAAAVMILFQPRVLLSDVGFQLSFMAVWGISYVSPLLAKYFKRLPELWKTKEILIATLSAQVATLPLLLYYFGIFSPISIIANILILPIIPYLTVWGLGNLLVAAVSLPLGRIMGLISWLLAAYWIKIAGLLHLIPFGYFDLGEFDLLALIISYAIIFCVYWLVKRRQKFDSRANLDNRQYIS